MNKRLKNILITIAFPVASCLIMELLCMAINGRHFLNSFLDIKTLMRNTGITAIIAFGLSFNLTCGRFDLSLGAQRLAGTIVGGQLALTLGLSGVWLLLFAFAFGFLFGFITGMVFITLRIPPMVLGVGIGLIWECVGYIASQGKGLNLFGVKGMEILTDTTFIIVLVVVVAILVSILLNSTKFGYQMRAIQGSQIIAKNSGINIFAHAATCYTLAGALVCIAGVMDVSFSTQMTATLGMTSNGAVVVTMFPMLLGGYIARFSNHSVGIIVASLTVKLFSYGLTTLELSEANASVANMALFIGFLVFLANQNLFKNRRAEQARITLANTKKQEKAVAAC